MFARTVVPLCTTVPLNLSRPLDTFSRSSTSNTAPTKATNGNGLPGRMREAMNRDVPIHGQIEPTIPQSLALCVRSLAALVKQRAHERDLARLEREVAARERDTMRVMLSVALGLLHMAERRCRTYEQRALHQSSSAGPTRRRGTR